MQTNIILPTQPTPPTTKNPKVVVLYGPPKVGKTTVLAQLPNCLILDFEKGTDHLSALRIQVESREHLMQIVAAIKAAGKPYDYVALDTVSAMEDWAEELATAQYKASVIGKNFEGKSVLELPKGGGYLYLRLAFAELAQAVASVTNKLIMVGHVRDKELDKVGTQGVAAKDIDLTGKIRNIVCSRADAVGYLYRKQGQNQPLMVSFQTVDEVNCGSRCDHLKGQVFEFDWNKIYLPE